VQPPPEGQQRPGPLERHRAAVVDLQRLSEGRVEVVLQHAAAPRQRGVGHRPDQTRQLACVLAHRVVPLAGIAAD
jgi:hypothetical protein